MAKLQIGDRVQCRYFNSPEGKFYGDYWIGTIIDIQMRPFSAIYPYLEQQYFVKEDSGIASLWLHRKEIKRKVK